MAQIDKYLQLAVQQNASDLHMSAGVPPYIRINGDLAPLEHPPLTTEQNKIFFSEIMNERAKNDFKERRQVDFIYALGNVARFRSNVFLQRKGISGAFRLIPNKITTAEELNLPEPMIAMCHLKKGLVLVTGPTGSGKSTTLAAMIDYINRKRNEHIITIEDPIEFVHQNKSCLITQRQLGEHVNSFVDALRAALREDPDVILVGEMRDLDTIALAITAAETGHLVFGTLHTTSAAKTVDRIIDAFPISQQEQIRTVLSESLKGVISQVLLKRADGGGRIAAYELLMGVKALANIIRENKCFQIPSLMQTQRGVGMQLMDQALLDLCKQKKITAQQASEYAVDKAPFLGNTGAPPTPSS